MGAKMNHFMILHIHFSVIKKKANKMKDRIKIFFFCPGNQYQNKFIIIIYLILLYLLFKLLLLPHQNNFQPTCKSTWRLPFSPNLFWKSCNFTKIVSFQLCLLSCDVAPYLNHCTFLHSFSFPFPVCTVLSFFFPEL